jgi:hypothetical protein
MGNMRVNTRKDLDEEVEASEKYVSLISEKFGFKKQGMICSSNLTELGLLLSDIGDINELKEFSLEKYQKLQ